jgi:hypothetical protein
MTLVTSALVALTVVHWTAYIHTQHIDMVQTIYTVSVASFTRCVK